MDGARLPGTRTPDDERIVAHVDMDCFYASCERLREPALEGEPLVVGMGFKPGENHGAVATASYEAREYGVESAMTITEALDRLPRKIEAVEDPELDVDEAGFYRPVDMEFYESVSEDAREILHERAAVVREVSIDEAYLDVTDRADWSDVRDWAETLKDDIEESVGVTASVGVAPTMSAAKVASDHDKPDGLVVVEPGEVRDFFADLPVEAVHGVGPVTATALGELDIETAGDLATADPDVLEDHFGERGLEIYSYARGEDDRDVTPRGRPKSLSRESAFGEATKDTAAISDRIRSLAVSVAERATSKGALYQTIGIKIVTPPFDVNTRAHSLPGPVDDPDLVEEVALQLYEEFEDARVRKVGVRVSNLSFTEDEQASLGGFEATGETADGNGSGADRVETTTERRDETTGDRTDGPEGQASLEGFEATGETDTESEQATDREESTSGSSSETASRHDDAPEGQASLEDF